MPVRMSIATMRFSTSGKRYCVPARSPQPETAPVLVDQRRRPLASDKPSSWLADDHQHAVGRSGDELGVVPRLFPQFAAARQVEAMNRLGLPRQDHDAIAVDQRWIEELLFPYGRWLTNDHALSEAVTSSSP